MYFLNEELHEEISVFELSLISSSISDRTRITILVGFLKSMFPLWSTSIFLSDELLNFLSDTNLLVEICGMVHAQGDCSLSHHFYPICY